MMSPVRYRDDSSEEHHGQVGRTNRFDDDEHTLKLQLGTTVGNQSLVDTLLKPLEAPNVLVSLFLLQSGKS